MIKILIKGILLVLAITFPIWIAFMVLALDGHIAWIVMGWVGWLLVGGWALEQHVN